MRVRFILAVASVLLLRLPALADEQSQDNLRGPQADSAAPAAQASTTKPPSATATKNKQDHIPIAEKAASFAAGFVVGTPIACLRLGVNDAFAVEKTIPIVGKSDNPLVLWTGRAFVYPGSALVGLFEGPFYAWYKSRTMAGSKPFSRDAFSLGEIEKYEIRCQQ